MKETIVYKLTDQDMRTYKGFQWELGKEYKTNGRGDLCSSGWLHVYSDPRLAIILNPIHANIQNPRLFEALAKGNGKHDNGLKSGYRFLTLTKELTLPIISDLTKRAFAILCAKEVYYEPTWNQWANDWLNGKDRSEESMYKAAAAYAADAADAAAAYAAAACRSKNINLVSILDKAMEIKE